MRLFVGSCKKLYGATEGFLENLELLLVVMQSNVAKSSEQHSSLILLDKVQNPGWLIRWLE